MQRICAIVVLLIHGGMSLLGNAGLHAHSGLCCHEHSTVAGHRHSGCSHHHHHNSAGSGERKSSEKKARGPALNCDDDCSLCRLFSLSASPSPPPQIGIVAEIAPQPLPAWDAVVVEAVRRVASARGPPGGSSQA
ncbi:hypothetical protein [Planctomyces sp. SH-PL14]|uniref:hypothetical protein n=1 Tax=Planctomyces sp. SH-PL14 TaxID=1632864 RepID=UPI000946147E|nr:hypothetical protein [Planctomyces sp. SH-PL14]